ncbi:M13 family metallopeptidase [Alteromonas sp. a30]|uniref:M13 family metallopeptidase n=1 Tax=Alteromonas sp. a30 TaxID=2730917 RepID=UPI002280B531|nr:M13 family metallopeptidase [Alteromonas sp. a30]MCY7296077.1 M13 family metallopeptidase [Alteromonas sp. a30]
MNKRISIAVAISLALGTLTACGPNPATMNDAAKAKADAVETKAAMISGVDLSAIDKNVRAQDDFFRYANGSWLSETEIPADKSRFGMFNVVHDRTQKRLKNIIQNAAESDAKMGSNEQKLGDMYNSFMDIELVNKLGVSPLKPNLDAIAAIDSKSGVAAKLGEMFEYGVGGPFGFYVYADAKNPEQYAMWLYQSGLSLPDRDYYLEEDEKYVNFRAELVKYIGNLLRMGGYKDPEQFAEKIMALETLIAQKHITKVERRDAEKNYNRHTVEELRTLLGDFDWDAYAKASGIENTEAMIVRALPYFQAFSEVFGSADVETWKAYMAYNLLDAYAPRLSQDFVDLHFAFHATTLNGVPENRDRWKRAVSATSNVLGEVLGQQYVAKHFTPEAKAKMSELVDNLISAYGDSIKDLEWMSEETKKAALDKLSKFTPKIGYPDKWRDYSSLKIKADDLVGNYMRHDKFEHLYWVERIGKQVDPTDWGMTPQTINAYYSPTRNEIVFPAGILQPPFFNLEAEDAVNYGAIGVVIGHEIGHGFDDQGSKYDGDGNLRSWWTENDRSAFDVLGEKLAAQFDAYEPIEGLHVNGQLTKGENIGDLAGVTIAYKAYKMSLNGKGSPVIDGFTGEQRFFMGHAQAWRAKYREDRLRSQILSDPHSPSEYRVVGPLVNVDAFYQAFGVEEGDGMYVAPEDRVVIW